MSQGTRILVLRTGQVVESVASTVGPFDRLFTRGLAASRGESALNVGELDVTACGADDALPDLRAWDGFIMTGSPAFVSEQAPWMAFGVRLLRRIVDEDRPLLAVCFGHQLLGVALGADVGPNPWGREMGTIDVVLEQRTCALFSRMPERFEAQCTHRDVIRDAGAHLKVIGRAPHDPCHVVQAGEKAWGVQFHPEFTDRVVRLFIEERRHILEAEWGPGAADERLGRVRATPTAHTLLDRFTDLCADN